MPPSRAAVTAKTARRFQQKRSITQSKALSSKFTEKQSHFARQREESLVRRAQQHADGGFAGANDVTSGDGLLGDAAAWRRQDSQLSVYTSGATDAPSPFELASRSGSGRGASGGEGKTVTTRSSVLLGMPHPSAGTRSTRRIVRFNLSDGVDGAAGAGAVVGELSGSAMGLRRAREPPMNSRVKDGLAHLPGSRGGGDEEGAGREEEGGDGDGEPPAKLTKEERFRQVVSNSRSRRAQLQRERAERDAETIALDKEINSLLHLLPKRNAEKEDREAFARSGTPAVRELLRSYKRGHTAKRLTLKSSGEYSVTDLSSAKIRPDDPDNGNDGGEGELSERGKELLARIRDGTGFSASATAEEVEEEVAAPGESATAGRAMDDFDVMLHQLRMDTRRAHAADRLLDESEEAELEARQALLEEDRRAVPSLGLAEADLVQYSRSEWLRRGGDSAFQMDDGDGSHSARDGNADILSSSSSSYDSGSDGESVVVEEEEDPTAGVSSSQGKSSSSPLPPPEGRPVVGSAVLDRLLSEVESLASPEKRAKEKEEEEGDVVAAREQRQRRFLKLLLQLHQYAKAHAREAANAFRLVLIEAERSFLRGRRRALSAPMMLSLAVIANVFPMSDYRHEVSTPFLLFLSSTVMQMRLDSLESVHCYVGLCALLTQSIRSSGGKFIAEAVTALLNVLALQLPRSVVEPVRHQGLRLPIPMVERSDDALLATGEASPTQRGEDVADAGAEVSKKTTTTTTPPPTRPWRLLETHHSPEDLVLCAYHQLTVLADTYSPIPAFPTILHQPFTALDKLLTARQQSAEVRGAHVALQRLLEGYAADAEAHRAPLAMRVFRPRPIRLFEPLLEEREESAVKAEIRLVKREIREDKKRVVRHLTAEAAVDRSAREKEQSAIEAAREKKLHQIMGALQQQQHTMNTVDTVMAKAKSKRKKSISGAPRTDSDDA